MAELICGVVSPEPTICRARLDLMTSAMTQGLDSRVHRWTHHTTAMARIEIAPRGSGQATPDVALAHLDDGALAGSLDLAHWSDDPQQRRISLPEILESSARSGLRETLDRLDGEFTLAHWQGSEETLTLVRDRLGTRSLYFGIFSDGSLAFASLPGALRALGLGKDPHLPTLARAVVQSQGHGSKTLYAGIERVLPGHMLKFTLGSDPRQTPYWMIDGSGELPANLAFSTVGDKLRKALSDAVRLRLPTVGPAYTHMSGGLDSTAIAAFAAQLLAAETRTVQAYAFVPKEMPGIATMIDERPAIAATCARYANIAMTEIDGTSFEGLATQPVSKEYPGLLDPDMGYERLLADAAQRGARIVLSGFGGDECASHNGKGALAEMLMRLQIRPLVRAVAGRSRQLRRHPLRVLAADVFGLLPDWLRKLLRKPPPSRLDFIRPAWRPVVKATTPKRPYNTRAARAQRLIDGHLSIQLEELAWRAARHGLAYSFPLLDRNVVELSTKIPARFLLWQGTPRAAFREALHGVLPDEARLRTEKLLADNGRFVRVAEDREAFRQAALALSETPAAQVIDVPRLLAAIDAFATPSELMTGINAEGAQGRQFQPSGAQFLTPLLIGRALSPNSVSGE